ncbi:hypothetical protein Tco_0448256 [Tanacetum coccineum]
MWWTSNGGDMNDMCHAILDFVTFIGCSMNVYIKVLAFIDSLNVKISHVAKYFNALGVISGSNPNEDRIKEDSFVASDDLRDALSVIFGLSELKAPRSPEYVPDPMELEDHVPVYIPEPEHPEDLVPAEDEAPTPPLPPFFLSPRIRPPHTRAAMRQMRAAAPSTYHSLLPSGTPPLPGCEVGESSAAAAARQPGPTMAHRVDHSLVDTMETRFRDTERRMMTALEMVNMRVSYQVDVRSRESSEFYSRHHDAQKDRAAVRAEIEVLRRERLAYEQESIQTRQDLARSEAHCRALEARVTVLETEVRRHEWQRQATDDLAVQHIMRTQALEAGARIDTLEDTGSSS